MKFGVNTYIWSADFTPAHLDLLPRIKAGGFDGVEIPIFRPAQFAAATIRRSAEAVGLERTAVASLLPDLSLISDDADVRQRTVQHLRDVVQATAELGARLFTGPSYAPVGYLPGRRRTDDEWKRAIEGYQQLGETLETYDVSLGIEALNRFETFFLNTAADGAALCDAVSHPRVGLLFDTFHANIEEKHVGDAIRTAGRHIKHVHTCENDRGTPGTGHVAWDEVFAALRDIGYDDWLTIESFGFALGDLSAAAAIWRDIEPAGPESIAFEGVKFLRRRAVHERHEGGA
ncbi:MAG: sugar phosphate isomerase [Acidobacteria bacterium SCN 69-37]|nr:MAG: sugar phosphate isomerase [Acidobacteria bacterium SCN 69-37]